MTDQTSQTEENEQNDEMERAERAFSVFLLEQLHEDLCKMNKILKKTQKSVEKKHIKMMEGFRCVEKAFKTLSGSIVSLSDDLGSAVGNIATDPWRFDA